MTSILYLCANHIGDPQDWPPRSINIIREADMVFCEDTRTAGRQLATVGIKKKLFSYHDHNERKRAHDLKPLLKKQDLTIALLSESGLPMISDPGFHLVNLFHELELSVKIIPGPTAFVCALVLSGFPPTRFQFLGFWPRKKKQQNQIMEEIQSSQMPFIFYESPFRLLSTLKSFAVSLPRAQVFVIKDITKSYETYWRGATIEIYHELQSKTLKGEFACVVWQDT